MASNRKPLSPNTSPTLRIGVTVTPFFSGVSIEGLEVLKPPLAACADMPEMTVAIASTAQANAIRRRMFPPSG